MVVYKVEQKELPLSGFGSRYIKPPKGQLLKWIGNKQRFAKEIVSYFPLEFFTYFEPFLGSGAVLATLAPRNGVGSDSFLPLIRIWQTLKDSPEELKNWYTSRWYNMMNGDKVEVYNAIKNSYNTKPNAADLLFLCRSCYGGVVRFRMSDGYMSTPCGVHKPISPDSFARRVDEWHNRLVSTSFCHKEFEKVMDDATKGDLIYCDPPYNQSQSILYGAQSFSLEHLFEVIAKCKSRGVYIALSIDGKKQSGNMICNLPIPKGLFKHEIYISCGRSMLKRFQMEGKSLENEEVADRLMLTY